MLIYYLRVRLYGLYEESNINWHVQNNSKKTELDDRKCEPEQ